MSGEGNIGKNLCLAKTTGANKEIRMGRHTTASASDTVDTGLESVDSVAVSLESDPTLANTMWATAAPGSGGNITIKTWKPTGAGDVTPIAATTFGKIVSWVAIGKSKT